MGAKGWGSRGEKSVMLCDAGNTGGKWKGIKEKKGGKKHGQQTGIKTSLIHLLDTP